MTGDLEGTISERITQTWTPGAPDLLIPITTFFTIETGDGTIEGYYSGAYYVADLDPGTDATFLQYGQVLSVTPAYGNLYLAEVFYTGMVDFNDEGVPLNDSGTIIIAPR